MGKPDSTNTQTTFSPSLNVKLTGIVPFEDINGSGERPSSESRTSPESENANIRSDLEAPLRDGVVADLIFASYLRLALPLTSRMTCSLNSRVNVRRLSTAVLAATAPFLVIVKPPPP